MRNFLNTICIVLFFIALIPIIISCKKHEVPALTTTTVTNITGTTATSGGTITDEGSGTIVERGICWSKGITPTVAGSRTIEGGGAGTFISNMSDLDAATTYYVQAYATNEAGIGYGMAMSFTTLGQAPAATTQSATNVATTSATLNGEVNGNYLSTTVTFEYGTTVSYGQTIHATQNPVTGSSNTNVSAEITGLAEGTTYHFRVKTVNSLGITNGNDMAFITLGQAPSAIAQSVCCITASGGRLNGTVNANYVSTSVTFEYGTTNEYGMSVVASPSPVTGNTNTNVSANLSGLSSGTTYHFRLKAVNSLGTNYCNDVTFTTLNNIPTNGLVGYYSFNGNAHDQTINGNHGTISGATQTTDRFGRANGAYYFDGIDDDITGTINNWPLGKSARTISLWGKLHTLPLIAGTNSLFLTYGQGTLQNVNSIYFQYVEAIGKSVVYSGYLDDVNVLFNYTLNTWYNIVVTFDGTVAAIYIDGILIAQESKSTWNTLSSNFHFGNFDNLTSWLNGAIDDIRIYDRVLTQDEILLLYNEAP